MHAVGYTFVTAGTLEAPPVAIASGVLAAGTGGLAGIFVAATGAVDSGRLDIAVREDDHQPGQVTEQTTAEIVGEWIGAGVLGTTATAMTFASGPVISIPVSTGAIFIGAVGGHIIADKLYGDAGVTPPSSSRHGR